MSNYFQCYIDAIAYSLGAVICTDDKGCVVSDKSAIVAFLHGAQAHRGRLLFVGNGASAGMASHMALDWTKNGGIVALSFNDGAWLTALANDLGADHLFALAIERHARPGDVLVAISSSGNSSNIVNAITQARASGLKVITLTGLKPDNKCRSLGDLNYYVPAKTYGIVECAHQVLLHAWIDEFMGVTEWGRSSVQNMSAKSGEFQL